MNKAKTMQLSGNEYAKVAERLRIFREANPNGLIETTPNINVEAGTIVFSARILKDKSNPDSGEGTGHSYGSTTKAKDFEKLETIAVGRALAMLGYMASGEIASTEEMEEFNAYKEAKVQDAIDLLNSSETIVDLKATFLSLGPMMANTKVNTAKDLKKAELSKPSTEKKDFNFKKETK